MRNAVLFAAVIGLGFTGAMATYQVDPSHSNLGFKVRHLGLSSVNGTFTDYEATATVDPADLSTLQAQATIQVASVDTGVERRDNHLRSDDFFNAEAHPTMTFVSTGVQNVDGNEFELVGDLTIRDVTKEVVLEGELVGMAEMRGNTVLGFELEGRINRFDFGLKWNSLTEAGGLIVGEDVRLILELEAAAQ